jgi:glutamyl-tRNA synthetase
MSNNTTITRIAPSPTGHMHIGLVRTALCNYLFARAHGGRFVFRSEDTDKARSKPEYETAILEGLEWLGLEHDEFARQSERTEIYRNHLAALIETDAAYVSKEPSKADPTKEVEVIRLRNPGSTVVFNDLVRGDISFDTTELGDFVIARASDDALYHFTVVVDDFLMGVTHIIRGEEHISNTPRQILIQQALGAPRPRYAHLPLILAPDRSKLSKRHGAVSLTDYRNEGFLKEAIINYLALLGWNPGTDRELFSLSDLIELFSLDHMQKGGAIFDREKFLWFNREYIKTLSDDQLFDTVQDWLPEDRRDADREVLRRLLPLVRERIHTLSEITAEAADGEFTFAFERPNPSPELLKWKKDARAQDALPRLQKVARLLDVILDEPSAVEVKEALWKYAEEEGKGEVLWPLRVALTGRERSPDPFSVVAVIGKREAQDRIKKACDIIEHA